MPTALACADSLLKEVVLTANPLCGSSNLLLGPSNYQRLRQTPLSYLRVHSNQGKLLGMSRLFFIAHNTTSNKTQ